MKRRFHLRWLLLAVAAAVVLLTAWSRGDALALNPTISMPRGLYTLAPIETPVRGDVVEACIPALPAAQVYRTRGYLPPAKVCACGLAPVLKPIVAVPGDRVEVTPLGIRVNGSLVPNSQLVDTDSQGLPIEHLPLGWTRTLASGDYFLVSNHIARSLDSRYFGPVQRADIRARARALWTF